MVAAGLGSILFLLNIFAVLPVGSASLEDVPQRQPHLIGCVSANMETFHCRWNVGTFQNLSKPGDLRLYFINKKSPLAPPLDWSECPHYTTDRPNECFFNETYTSVWTYYSVQLRSRDGYVLYDEDFFNVQDIVQPDPPVNLKWMLLNVSVSSSYYDIMVSWKPPESADVEMGWMTLQYEVQYRDVNAEEWITVDLVKSTHRSLYGLQSNVNHEIRVRCKMLAGKDFGGFSSSIFVHIPSKVSRFPVMGLLIFGALCLVAILMLVLISQQEKLMFLLLPPVPGPKIKGIDPELLKQGKLRELKSILGGPPDLRPELYNSDPWIEYIDLDIDKHNDRLSEHDNNFTVDHSVSDNCLLGFRDDDSGRASCCDPDLPIEPEVLNFHPLVPNLSRELYSEASQSCLPIQSLVTEAPGSDEAMYTQVSEVRSSGKVLLSLEDQAEALNPSSQNTEKNLESKKNTDFNRDIPDHSAYTSVLNVPCSGQGSQSSSSSSVKPDEMSSLNRNTISASAPVYTVVEGIDIQNSLVLTPNFTPAPQLIIPKAMPTPDGYLTPDLLGSVTP